MKTNDLYVKGFLIAALGHLLCWAGGDLLLYFVPNGPLDTMRLFGYEATARMLLGANPLQFTVSGICGTVAMMLALVGYYQIHQFLKPVAPKAARIVLAGAILTCVAGAVMHVSMTMMLWYFVRFGATQQAHAIMLTFFYESIPVTVLCNTGVFLVSIPLLVTVAKGKTCLPKWAWLVNTLPLTLAAAVVFAGMGAMNVGSALMFFGLYHLIRKA